MRIAWMIAAASLACAQPDASRWKQENAEGRRLFGLGQFSQAEAYFRSALAESEKFGENDERYWSELANLALMRFEQGDLAGSETLYRRSLQLQEAFLPQNSTRIAIVLTSLASLLHSAGRDAEAEPLARRAVKIGEDAADDKITAPALNALGLVLMGLGEDARAEPVLRRSLALLEKTTGPDSLDVGRALNNLAGLYSKQREWVKAEQEQRRALAIYENGLPPDHSLLASVMSNMATMLVGLRRFDEAEQFLERARQIVARSVPDSVHSLQIRANFAVMKAARGDWKSAAALLEQVIPDQERVLGPAHPNLAASLEAYAEVLKHLKRTGEAKVAARRASAISSAFRH